MLNINLELKSTKYFPDNHTKMFQEGIKPMWEDERNKKGGRWLINLDKKQRASCLDNFWLEVVSGQKLGIIFSLLPSLSDHINMIFVATSATVGRIKILLTA